MASAMVRGNSLAIEFNYVKLNILLFLKVQIAKYSEF